MYDTFQYYRSVPRQLSIGGEADWAVKGSCKAQARAVEVGSLRYIALLGTTIEGFSEVWRMGDVLLISLNIMVEGTWIRSSLRRPVIFRCD